MEFAIEQALQQGMAIHRQGRLQEAEQLYRAILKIQPAHPYANNNLGVLFVAINQPDLALPHFKAALEEDLNNTQFWLSYIHALIMTKQLHTAKVVLSKAIKEGLTGKGFDELSVKLGSIACPENDNLSMPKKTTKFPDTRKIRLSNKNQRTSNKTNITNVEPPHQKINYLMECYKNAHYYEAEKTALSIIDKSPNHLLSWKILGILFGQDGRLTEALNANKRAAQLAPLDPEVLSNMATTLQDLDRLEEAEVGYRKAIGLKPDFFIAHCNLGVTLCKLGRLDEGIVSYNEAIELKSDYPKAHYNLANALRDLRRFDQSEGSYRRAITLKPNYAQAHTNFASLLLERGRLEEAELSYRRALAIRPDYAEAFLSFSILLDYMNNLKESADVLEYVIKIDSGYCSMRADVNLAIIRYLQNSLSISQDLLLRASEINNQKSAEFKNDKIYRHYLLDILSWHTINSTYFTKTPLVKKMHVIGDSHVLVSHGLTIKKSGSDLLCQASLIKGCKQSHIGSEPANKYKSKLEKIFLSLPNNSNILLVIGEIDCRIDDGIIPHSKKYSNKNISEIINDTVKNYLKYVGKINVSLRHNLIIQGVPCPNVEENTILGSRRNLLIDTIREFNIQLKSTSKNMGFGYLDVYTMTDKGDGFSNAAWHLDAHHLTPGGMLEAWAGYGD